MLSAQAAFEATERVNKELINAEMGRLDAAIKAAIELGEYDIKIDEISAEAMEKLKAAGYKLSYVAPFPDTPPTNLIISWRKDGDIK